MARFSSKTKWTSILAGTLCVVLIFGVVAGILSDKDESVRSIGASYFEIGGLNNLGQFVETDQSLVSEYIPSGGLKIEPGAYATGCYQIYYYTEDKLFIGCSDVFSTVDGVYEQDPYVLDVYARILLIPDKPLTDDDELDEGFRIRFWEVSKYVKEFDISVSEKQSFMYLKKNNVFDTSGIQVDKSYIFAEGATGFSPGTQENHKVSKLIEIPEGTTAISVMWKEEADNACWIVLFDEMGYRVGYFDLREPPSREAGYNMSSLSFKKPISEGSNSTYRYIAFEFLDYTEIRLFFLDDPEFLKKE